MIEIRKIRIKQDNSGRKVSRLVFIVWIDYPRRNVTCCIRCVVYSTQKYVREVEDCQQAFTVYYMLVNSFGKNTPQLQSNNLSNKLYFTTAYYVQLSDNIGGEDPVKTGSRSELITVEGLGSAQ